MSDDIRDLVKTGQAVITDDYNRFEIDREVWERQPWESDRDFELFSIYRDLPPMKRSIKEAVRIYTNVDEYPKRRVPDCYKRLATHNRWQERSEAYCMYLDTMMRERLEEARVQARLQFLDVSETLKKKADEALSVLEAIITDEDGNIRANFTPKQILELYQASLEFQKFALKMDVETTPGVSVQILNVADSRLLQEAQEVLEAHAEVTDALPE